MGVQDLNIDITSVRRRSLGGRLLDSDMLFPIALLVLMATLLLGGRLAWDTSRYDATQGWGYWAGIVGGSFIVIAAFYAMFKHATRLRTLGFNRNMLRVHIFFGVAGPFIVTVHSGLEVKSVNGGVALYSVLAVFLSGVIGRYLYSKTHRYQDAREIEFQVANSRLNDYGLPPSFAQAYAGFVRTVLSKRQTLFSALMKSLRYDSSARKLRRQCAQLQGSEDIFPDLDSALRLLKRVAKSNFYERFFAFWRYAHVPLIFLMLISGIVHVLAVHLY